MKPGVLITAALLAGVTLFGEESLMPQKNRISIHGLDGVSFQARKDRLVLKREKPGVQVHMRGFFRFRPNLKGTFAPDDALVIELKSDKDFMLGTRWRKNNRRACAQQEIPVSKSEAFQTVCLPLPETGGVDLDSMELQLYPDPGTVEIRDIRIAKPKQITLRSAGNPTKAQDELILRGTTAVPEAPVEIRLSDAQGKTVSRKLSSKNGTFELRWKRPPLTVGAWNTATALIGEGKNENEISIPLRIFGYRADDEYAWIRVKGKQFATSPKSKDGEQEFIPVGIGYCRDVIIPAQDEEAAKFCKARNLNTLRLSFYTRFFNNNDKEPLSIEEHIRDFIAPVVLAAKRNNMYVILDDHGYFTAKIDEAKARQTQKVPRWNEEGFNEWIRRWVKVAEYFKDEPAVLGYELLNEPHDISPEATRDWYIRCLKAIRTVDQRHILLLGNADWSHARAMEKTWGPVASTVDAPFNNVAFTFHDYPDDNHPWHVANSITTFRDKHNVPVLCTEFGATHWNKTETACRSFIAGMVTLFARERVGWMIWALKRLEDNPRTPHLAPRFDSCGYSDIWIPAARITASPVPQPR